MTSVAGRKKSIVSNAGFQIDTPVAHNTLLNKAASSSTSLYQQCSALRARLMRLPSFPDFFAISSPPDSSRQSTDPVTQLWDCFALGFPLCYIFNLLPPPIAPIAIDTDPASVDVNNKSAKKRAIALFAMQLRQVPECEQFTVTDLWERHSNDGFVKAVKTVTMLVDRLPENVFMEAPPSSPPSIFPTHESSESLATSEATPHFSAPANAQEAARMNIIREMVETERKYVQDLEVMQNYSNALSQSNTIDQDTIHLLFPNLNKLLNFQRKFLIRFEGTAEMSWKDQRWGCHFIECEEEFAVYEPYCANYNTAQDIMLAEEQNLMSHNNLINVKSELPAFLIKPVQRICKYPLLLESLVKASPSSEYPHYDELVNGCAAAKRITDRINEAQRRAENKQTVKNLESRVEDWKGHHLSNFGDLLLDDIFVVTKSDVDREYHVFLFEKIILCCKEASQSTANGKKVNKSNSLLKKPPGGPTTPLPGGVGPPKKKTTSLLLKGRIFLNNVTQAAPNTKSGYSLAVWWKGEDDLEHFTLRCRTDEQLRQWEAAINRLIYEVATRKLSERTTSKFMSQMSNSTSPAPQVRPGMPYNHEKTYSTASQTSYGTLPPYPGPGNGRSNRLTSPYSSEEQIHNGYVSVNGGGPYGYPPYEGGFDLDPDDDYEDYPPAISRPPSGRGTPVGGRRSHVPSSVDRDGYETAPPMARVASQSVSHPPVPGLPSAPISNRPSTTRISSAASVASHASDASFGNGVKPKQLRSQFSSTKLKASYDVGEGRPNTLPPNGMPSIRTRSASQPSAYVPRQVPPPMPTAAPWVDQTRVQARYNKRESGSSQSTGDSSDDSPQTTSPITPYGSSDSSIGGALRTSRSQNFDKQGPQVKVKVHFHEDIFVIQVPKSTEYVELVERVGRKIRLCGPRRDDGPLRVKYRDEDGDMVSLGSTEDVQMAFESYRPGSQVTLYVT
ncbi:hypothetical protein NEOLEDRAFT_1076967 [Neolentinus lepideus HHB14362 ss-1]|uniref:RhoGEF-domain-containing protein n=1 Tax=Neolentinus lepideus HHB14362 ss-1 TaxID=1314782 RepID=A0A165NP90_9AGAM|nr:hypothetical protein NEOLEDRAFT_1076967 [Neolentinus lepideus HHB14362 ss-1]